MKFLFSLIIALTIFGTSFATSWDDPYYDYRGANSFREDQSFLQTEQLDPFTGNVTLIYRDLFLPGNGGLDLSLYRVYNSTIYRDLNGAETPVPDSWMGFGWLMHMGRLVVPDGSEPRYLEMPDGSKHAFYIDINNTNQWISKEYWILKINGNYFEILFTDGVKWRFDMTLTGIVIEPNVTHIYYPTKEIVSPCDPNNNKITINYTSYSGTTDPCILSIVDACNRSVDFHYINTSTTCDLDYIVFNGKYIRYTYQTIPGNSMYQLLQKVQLPADGSGYYSFQYEYETTNWPLNELRKAYNPWGGRVEYTFITNQFNIAGEIVYYRALNQRKETDGSNYNAVWSMNYAQAGDLSDSTLITDPYGSKTSFTMFGYRSGLTSGNFWKLGLVNRKRISNAGGQLLLINYTFAASPAISNDDYWAGYGNNYDSQVFVPRVTQRQVTMDSKNYTIANSNFDNYSHPRTITETGDATRTRTLTYNTNSTLIGLNIVELIATDQMTYNSTSITNSYNYYTSGAIGKMSSKTVAGVTTNYTYFTNGNLNRITDADSRWIDYSNYQYGVSKTVNKNNVYSITRTVNPTGTIATETNGRGYQTSYTYDDRNRLVKTDLPGTADDICTEYATNSTYQKSGTKSGSSWTSWNQVNYDKFGRIDNMQNMAGILIDCRFDSVYRKTYESYPYTTTNIGDRFTYDGLNRLLRTTHPDNNYTENTYYQSKVTFRNERGKNTEYQYTAFGDPFGTEYLTSVKDALNQTTTYSYNAPGYLTAINAAGSYSRTYHYNSYYFMDWELSPERGTINYSYTTAGKVSQRTDANGNITGYSYDNVGRLTNVNYPGSTYDITNTYDNADNITQSAVSSNTVAQTFDEINRLTQKTLSIDSKTYSATFTYDGRSNVTRITYHDGEHVDYTYDNANRVLTIPGFINSNISYHPSGNPAGYTMANNRVVSYSYDNRYRVSQITVDGSVLNEQYGYDAADNLTTLTDNLGSYDLNLAYDDINRLTTFSGPWGSASYSYVGSYAVGRRYQETIAGNTTTYIYNTTTHRLNNTTGYRPYTFTYNNNGNITNISGSDIVLSITYDYENRATELTNSWDGYVTSCEYDGMGNRVSKRVDILPSKNKGNPKNRTDDFENLSANMEYYLTGPDGSLLFSEYEPFYKYVYLKGHRIGKFQRATKYFIHNDYLGNARAMTNSSGTVVYSWTNYPFGKDYSVTGGGNNYYRYTGKQYEPATKMDFFGARYYYPDLGRLITPDPVYFIPPQKGLLNPMRLNFYEHALNNPLKYVDPDGRDIQLEGSWITKLVCNAYKTSELFRWGWDYLRNNHSILFKLREVEAHSTDPAAELSDVRMAGKIKVISAIWYHKLNEGMNYSDAPDIANEMGHAIEIATNPQMRTTWQFKYWISTDPNNKDRIVLPNNAYCTQYATSFEDQVRNEMGYNQQLVYENTVWDDIQANNEDILKPSIP